jgi:hypothetical protein
MGPTFGAVYIEGAAGETDDGKALQLHAPQFTGDRTAPGAVIGIDRHDTAAKNAVEYLVPPRKQRSKPVSL